MKEEEHLLTESLLSPERVIGGPTERHRVASLRSRALCVHLHPCRRQLPYPVVLCSELQHVCCRCFQQLDAPKQHRRWKNVGLVVRWDPARLSLPSSTKANVFRDGGKTLENMLLHTRTCIHTHTLCGFDIQTLAAGFSCHFFGILLFNCQRLKLIWDLQSAIRVEIFLHVVFVHTSL